MKCRDIIFDPENAIIMVFDYVQNDLEQILKYHKDKAEIYDDSRALMRLTPYLQPMVLKSIMFQLLKGIEHLHQNFIVHRDLKPPNILIFDNGKDQRGIVKIADFGNFQIYSFLRSSKKC